MNQSRKMNDSKRVWVCFLLGQEELITHLMQFQSNIILKRYVTFINFSQGCTQNPVGAFAENS